VVVLAIRRGRGHILNPSKDEEIQPGDQLIVAGRNDQVSRLYSSAQELAALVSIAARNPRES
jgi:uncharacterized protein with PhoU and TrkA domain